MKNKLKRIVTCLASKLGIKLQAYSSLPLAADAVHAVRALTTGHGLTIADVGSNIGNEARSYYYSFPGSEIHCFEPIPTIYDQLSRNVKSLPGLKTYNYALGHEAGHLAITSNPNSTRNRIVEVETDESTTQVQVTTLDRFMEEH